jgi:flagellar protein FlaG
MIQSVQQKADLLIERVRKEEPPGVAGRPPRIKKGGSDGRSLVQESADHVSIDRAATRVNEVLSLADPQLKIEIDQETQRVIVKILERKSGEVIRQIPPEELLELEKYLSSPKGLLVQEQA